MSTALTMKYYLNNSSANTAFLISNNHIKFKSARSDWAEWDKNVWMLLLICCKLRSKRNSKHETYITIP